MKLKNSFILILSDMYNMHINHLWKLTPVLSPILSWTYWLLIKLIICLVSHFIPKRLWCHYWLLILFITTTNHCFVFYCIHKVVFLICLQCTEFRQWPVTILLYELIGNKFPKRYQLPFASTVSLTLGHKSLRLRLKCFTYRCYS